MKRDSFLIYRSFYEPVKGLTNEEKGILFDAICRYALDEITPDNLSPMLQIAFSFIGLTIDLNSKKYQNVVERNRENGKKGGRPYKEPKKPSGLIGNPNNPEEPKQTDNDNDNDNDNENGNEKKRTKVFTPPSLPEIQSYISERIKEKGSHMDSKKEAEKFEAFYSSKNWMVGKTKMTVWEKAVTGWIARDNTTEPPQQKNEIKLNPAWNEKPNRQFRENPTP